jgi:hypothetical protein
VIAFFQLACLKTLAPRKFRAKKRLIPESRMISAFQRPRMWYAPS